MKYEFDVKEVSVGGCLSWEAVERSSGHAVKLIDPYKSGEYPEIEAHLAQTHGFAGALRYMPALKDEFDQDQQTWTFRRAGDEVIVRDIPRTILRVTSTN